MGVPAGIYMYIIGAICFLLPDFGDSDKPLPTLAINTTKQTHTFKCRDDCLIPLAMTSRYFIFYCTEILSYISLVIYMTRSPFLSRMYTIFIVTNYNVNPT